MATTYTSVLEWDDGQELRITRYDSWLGRRLVYFFSWDAMYATDDLNVSVGTLRPSAHRRHQAQRARFQRHQARAGFCHRQTHMVGVDAVPRQAAYLPGAHPGPQREQEHPRHRLRHRAARPASMPERAQHRPHIGQRYRPVAIMPSRRLWRARSTMCALITYPPSPARCSCRRCGRWHASASPR